MSSVDDAMPFILNIFLANAAAFLGISLVIIFAQPVMLVLLVPLGLFYFRLQR